MHNVPLIIYAIIGVVNVLGHYLGYPEMVKFSKPMLMPALIFVVYSHAKGHVTLRILLLSVALVFSFLGDLALMQEDKLYFMLGLGAFLVTQGLYTYIYFKSTFEKPEFRLLPLLPILTFTIFFLSIIVPNTPDDLQIPIGIYALVITAMAAMARLRLGLTSNNSYQWVLTGSLLFVASDACIAVDKFFRPIPYDSVIIMGTYILAQLFIVRGLLDHPE
jgi:uncharacterized membrane protein YhhN